MKQITLNAFKLMKYSDWKDLIPFEITYNCETVAVVCPPDTKPDEDHSHIKTKCPNCKMVYQVTRPDNEPMFLSMQQNVKK